MKTVVALIVALFLTTNVFAQTSDGQAALAHRGHVRIWLGASIVLAGLIVTPVTAGGHLSTPNNGSGPLVGVGLIGAGGTLIYLGAVDRQKAQSANTTIGVTLGKVTAIQLRRSW